MVLRTPFGTIAGGVTMPRRTWGSSSQSVPTMKQRLFPPSCAPVMTSTGVRRQVRGLEHRVLLRMGRRSREAAAHRQ